MVDKIAAHRFMAVVGGSGSGKSSVVNCGFKPALRRGLLAEAGTSWRMVQIRPGGNPIRALAAELAQPGAVFENVSKDLPLADMLDATLRLSSRGLVDIYRQARLPKRTNLLVIVDQFEELFRYRNPAADNAYGPAQDTTAFIRLLLESAAQPDHPIYIALTMRSDFLGDCVQFDGLPEAINEGQYLVPRLTRDERRSVIEGPISSAGAVISPVLLTQLVNDVGDNPDQLSILQHALNRTWAHWRHEQGPITLENYEAIGTMAHALDQHANKAWKELASPRHHSLCERAFKSLTDRGNDQRGVRRPLRFANLCAIVAASDPSELVEVLKPFRKLSRSFVMPDEQGAINSDTWIDISHESFMRLWTKLREWADEEAEFAREYRRLSDRAIGHYRSPGKFGLMQDPDLQSALDFEKLCQPTASWGDLYGGGFEEATRFLRESETKREEESVEHELERIWQLRWQPAISGVLVLAFFCVVIWLRADLLPAPVQVQTNSQVTAAVLSDLIWSLLKIVLTASPFIAAWGASAYYGKKLHHRFCQTTGSKVGSPQSAGNRYEPAGCANCRACHIAEIRLLALATSGFSDRFPAPVFCRYVDLSYSRLPWPLVILINADPLQHTHDCVAVARNCRHAGRPHSRYEVGRFARIFPPGLRKTDNEASALSPYSALASDLRCGQIRRSGLQAAQTMAGRSRFQNRSSQQNEASRSCAPSGKPCNVNLYPLRKFSMPAGALIKRGPQLASANAISPASPATPLSSPLHSSDPLTRKA